MKQSVRDAAVENTAMLHEEEYKRNRLAQRYSHMEEREDYLNEWSDILYDALVKKLSADNMDDYDVEIEVREGFCNGADACAVFGTEVLLRFSNYAIQITGAGHSVQGKFTATFDVNTQTAGSDEIDWNFGTRSGETDGFQILAIFNALLVQGMYEAVKKVFTPAP